MVVEVTVGEVLVEPEEVEPGVVLVTTVVVVDGLEVLLLLVEVATVVVVWLVDFVEPVVCDLEVEDDLVVLEWWPLEVVDDFVVELEEAVVVVALDVVAEEVVLEECVLVGVDE